VLKSKSDNPLSPDYVPSVFNHTDSPTKRKLRKDKENFERRQALKKRRIENSLESVDSDDTDHGAREIQLDSPTDIDAVLFEKAWNIMKFSRKSSKI